METRKFAILRIVFGIIWAVDAYFKWQPAFFANFTSYLSGSIGDQPYLVKQWIDLWIHVIGINPGLFALFVALIETAIAFALILGIFPKLTVSAGVAMGIIIWSTAEGFGGPYTAGSTDIGAAIIYVLVFLALYFGHAWDDLRIIGARKPR